MKLFIILDSLIFKRSKLSYSMWQKKSVSVKGVSRKRCAIEALKFVNIVNSRNFKQVLENHKLVTAN